MKTGLWTSLALATLLSGCVSDKNTPPRVVTTPPADINAPRSVIVKGSVRYNVVPWTDDLTVAKAIVMADYIGARDPTSIIIRRQGERLFVSTWRLVQGLKDPWLEAGDILELWTAPILRPVYPYDLSSFDVEHAGLLHSGE